MKTSVRLWLVLWITLSCYWPPLLIRADSRAYPLGCSQKDPTYYDFESYSFPPTDDDGIPIKSTDDYMLVRRLGAGKFSDVFEAVDVQLEQLLLTNNNSNQQKIIDPRSLVVLKCLKPVAERKIKRELLVLQHASKLPNLARLLAVVIPSDYHDANKKYKLQSMPSLVLEHAGVDSQWLCHSKDDYLKEEEIRYFLYHLLVALDHLHSLGIMHRDVKPRNVLIDRSGATLMLIDLGLADFYMPDTRYNVRVASRHYKSPELLLGNEHYDYAIDMWGVGCILVGLLLRREPFFRG
jgi:casein kinase II subunit alpha